MVVRALPAVISVAMVLLAASPVAIAAPPPDPEVVLSGNAVVGLQQASRVADEDASRMLNIQLSLKLRDRAALDDLIRRVSTPGSLERGHYLSPAEFGARFGPTAAQVGQATAFFRANGLQVTAAVPGSTLVDARGTVAEVEQALHTRIGRYREVSGRDFYANDVPPALPAGLASMVVGVQGLENRYQRHHSAVQPHVCCAGTPYTPAQIQTAFKLNVAPLTGVTGLGQTLGLLELDDFQQSNINAYSATYSLPSLAPQRQPVDGGAALGGGQIEVELDLEVMHAVAPGATILVFEAPNSTINVIDAYGCMVSPDTPTAGGPCPNHGSGSIAYSNSTSWGECEPDQGSGVTQTLDQVFVQGAAQGQSFYAASGDSGAHDCTHPPNVDPALTVDSPASDPNITGVGGTKLFLNPDNSYNSEIAWPTEPQPYLGSGGGASAYFLRPSWQTGPGVITTLGASRQVPDVSLDADPATGYLIFTGGRWRSVGGTSAGAPGWAAFTAVYNGYAPSCRGATEPGLRQPDALRAGKCHTAVPALQRCHHGRQQGRHNNGVLSGRGLRHGHRLGVPPRGRYHAGRRGHRAGEMPGCGHRV